VGRYERRCKPGRSSRVGGFFELHLDRSHLPAAAIAHIDCRLLLAEDGPDNQMLISFILGKHGIDVTPAGDGRVAFDLAMAAHQQGAPFDVILMDMQMPEMDGYEVAQELRANGYQSPIIALRAHAMAEDRGKCLAAGCDDYATKPIHREALLEVISNHIGPRRRSQCPRPEVTTNAAFGPCCVVTPWPSAAEAPLPVS
jgi:CheY-like chemotaxis protein